MEVLLLSIGGLWPRTGTGTGTQAMVLQDERHLWPNATIPFTFYMVNREAGQQRVSAMLHKRIYAAMRLWSKNTCVRFVPWRGERLFANFVTRSDCLCCSDVGRQLNSSSVVALSASCDDGSILHEIGHLVGLLHTHERPDRDNYVEIRYKNVNPRASWIFDKMNSTDVNTRNYPYDFESVMHYHAYAFSDNGLPTILDLEYPLDSGAMSIRRRLSRIDVAFVNSLYGCKRKRCVATLTAPQGRFQVPEHFSLDKPCMWNFRVRSGQRLLLRLTNLNTKLQNPCLTEWVSLRSIGSPGDTRHLARFCGFSNDPIEFRVYAPSERNSSIRVVLAFFSRAPRFHTGFSAEYDIAPVVGGSYENAMVHYRHGKCNLAMTATNGTIASPFIPQFLRNDYPYIPSCHWHLKPRSIDKKRRNIFRIEAYISRVISSRPFQRDQIDSLLTQEHSTLDSKECIGAISLEQRKSATGAKSKRFHYACNTDWLTGGSRKPTHMQEFYSLEEKTNLGELRKLPPNNSFTRLRRDKYGAKLTFWIEAHELRLSWYSLWHLPFEMRFTMLTL